MEKKIRRFEIEYSFDWEYGIDISNIRKDLDNLEKLGATHIDINSSSSHNTAYVDFHAYTEREETDKECLERLNEGLEKRNSIKEQELEELKRLKAKYEI